MPYFIFAFDKARAEQDGRALMSSTCSRGGAGEKPVGDVASFCSMSSAIHAVDAIDAELLVFGAQRLGREEEIASKPARWVISSYRRLRA